MTKILIIEDEEPIRRVLKKILTEENNNFLLSEAEDGKDGIKLILEEDYDLILCDIKMPKMDGLEVLHEENKKKRLGQDIMPKRIQYRKLSRD